jgi:hypothetical protein
MKQLTFILLIVVSCLSSGILQADSGRGAWIAGNILGGVGAALTGPAYGPYDPYYAYPYYGPGPYSYGPYWGGRPYVVEKHYYRDRDGDGNEGNRSRGSKK